MLLKNLLRMGAGVLAVALLSGFAFACGDDDDGGSEEDKQAVEQAVTDIGGYGPEDVDAFLERVTDNALKNVFGYTREECKQSAEECVGEPSESVTTANTEVSGDTATTEATFSFADGAGGGQTFLVTLVREDGQWKLDRISTVPKEVPEGVKKVDLELKEFSFEFDKAQIEDGNFAFVVKNAGEQDHQVIVASIPEDLDIEEGLLSGDQPPGVEQVAFEGPYAPGDEGTVVFDEELAPGRYVLLCFVPDAEDPDETPHANKGMYAEFTVE